jgi:mono/diheme cytochrome c family protein
MIMTAAVLAALSLPALAGAGQEAVLAEYLKQAKAADAGFAGFSAERGKAFFLAQQTGGKPDTPSCTSCHGKDPMAGGQTRAGKAIDPMAVSAQADRYTDLAKTENWFGRNCNSVLGRDCTPQEKGDFIAFMSSL